MHPKHYVLAPLTCATTVDGGLVLKLHICLSVLLRSFLNVVRVYTIFFFNFKVLMPCLLVKYGMHVENIGGIHV